MWTVLWTDAQEDHWQRFETAGDVLDCLNSNIDISDVLIIPPRNVHSLEEMDEVKFRSLDAAGRF